VFNAFLKINISKIKYELINKKSKRSNIIPGKDLQNYSWFLKLLFFWTTLASLSLSFSLGLVWLKRRP
jgi:hypothetical protein